MEKLGRYEVIAEFMEKLDALLLQYNAVIQVSNEVLPDEERLILFMPCREEKEEPKYNHAYIELDSPYNGIK